MRTNIGNYTQCYGPLLRLAMPVVLAQAGQMLVTLVDTIMVGSLNDANLLAAVSFSGNLYTIVMFMGLGISLAITPVVGMRYGAGRRRSVAFWLMQHRYLTVLVGLGQLLLTALLWLLIPLMRQPEAVVPVARDYFLIVMFSILPTQIFYGGRQFAEGLANTSLSMLITVTGNLINILCNYLFIFGHFGCPQLGVYGAAVGTVVSKVYMAAAMEMTIRRHRLFAAYSAEASACRFAPGAMLRLLRLGLPIGGQMTVECFAFAAGGIMMGAIGAVECSAHQIVMTFTSLTYLMASGIASAITIKVSIFGGQADSAAIRRYSAAALQLVVAFMASTGLTFVCLRHLIPSLVIGLPEVVGVAATLMLVGGAFQIFDGLQVVCLGILRGMSDMTYPAVVSGVAYAATSLPVGYVLAFVAGAGAPGIWLGYLAGLVLASVLLLRRIRHLTARLNY